MQTRAAAAKIIRALDKTKLEKKRQKEEQQCI
jgi:hypothetical protein